jgi:hypothetical protein
MFGDLASQELSEVRLKDERHSESLGPSGGPRSLLPADVSPMIAQAQRAFRHDLPGLLLGCAGRWVAYHGERQVGCGDSMIDLYRNCFGMGIKPDELVVRLVDSEQLSEAADIDLTQGV